MSEQPRGRRKGAPDEAEPAGREAEVLRAAYRELETAARDYADPVTAVTTARRRRNRRAAVGAVLGVVAVIGAVAYGPWQSSSSLVPGPLAGGPPSATSTAGVTASTTAPGEATLSATAPAVTTESLLDGTGTPLTIRPPAGAAPLPAGSPGAAGALLYTSCLHGCPTYLVLTDGRQYLLGQQTPPPPGNLTLSVDGRWLGRPTGTGYELRDLVGGAVHEIAAPQSTEPGAVLSPWAWSADGRRLLLGRHRDGDPSAYVVVDLPSGKVSPLDVPRGTEPLGLLASGEPLLFDRDAYGRRATRLELAVGASGRRITLDAGSTALVTPDGGPSLKVRGERIYAVAPDLTTVVVFDDAGAELARLPLRPGEEPLAAAANGYALLAGPALELRTPSGDRTLHTLPELPDDALVVLPGQARH